MRFNSYRQGVVSSTIGAYRKLSNNPNAYGGDGSGWRDLSNYKVMLSGKVVRRTPEECVSKRQINQEQIGEEPVSMTQVSNDDLFKANVGVWDHKIGVGDRSGSYLGLGKGIEDGQFVKMSTAADRDTEDGFPEGNQSSRANADKVIKDNAQFILEAAEEFGINPGILAAAIYCW